MKTVPTALAVSLALVSALCGTAFGYSFAPEYRLSMFETNDMSAWRADRWVDLRYTEAMIAHHRGAVLLAEEARAKSERPEIVSLAETILAEEPKAIHDLYAWKKLWYRDSRSVRDPVVPRLGARDETFDLRFLNALIAHHESGIAMTRSIRLLSSRSEVLNNADSVEAFLRDSIATLSKWRSSWYGRS